MRESAQIPPSKFVYTLNQKVDTIIILIMCTTKYPCYSTYRKRNQLLVSLTNSHWFGLFFLSLFLFFLNWYRNGAKDISFFLFVRFAKCAVYVANIACFAVYPIFFSYSLYMQCIFIHIFICRYLFQRINFKALERHPHIYKILLGDCICMCVSVYKHLQHYEGI